MYSLKAVPTWNEVTTLLNKMRDEIDSVGLRDYCIVALLVTTGIRKSELLHLKKQDVDIKNGTIMIKQLKKQKQEEFYRKIALMPEIIPFLEKYMHHVPGDRLFTISPMQVTNIVHLYTKKYLNKIYRAHAFRHAFAIRILEKTRDIELCRRLLGHSRLETVKIYLDFMIEDRKNEIINAIRG